MQPTLNPNISTWRDLAIFNRFAVQTMGRCNRDDIVTFRSPEDPNRILVKRVLALEGDVVKTLPPYPDQEVVVPKGHVWVEGDDPFFSDDSNRFGPVHRALLDSKLVMIIWPLNRFGSIKQPAFPPNNYGQENRLAMTQLEREKARRSRVTIQDIQS